METDSIYSATHGETEKDEGCDEKGDRDQEREKTVSGWWKVLISHSDKPHYNHYDANPGKKMLSLNK